MSVSAKKIILFLFSVFFVADIWIFTYKYLLNLLNKAYLPDSYTASPSTVVPEPFEIPLYIFFSGIAVFFLIVLSKLYKEHKKKINKLMSHGLTYPFLLISLAALVSFFLKSLGVYPMAGDTFGLARFASGSFLDIFYIAGISVIIVILFFITAIQKLLKNTKSDALIIFSIVLIIVALVTFEPGLQMSGQDYIYFFSPVKQILAGKTIYTQAPSQYGFISILLLTFFSKLGLFSMWYLPALVWIMYVLEYSIIFHIVRKISRSFVFATMALISVIVINYFSLFHLPATYPQIGPLRWLPVFLVILLLYRLKNIHSLKFVLSVALLSLWFIDVGMSLILIFLSALLFLLLTQVINIKIFVKDVVSYFVSIIFFLGLINLLHIFLGYKPIDFISSFNAVKQYAIAGAMMVPVPSKSFFWFIPLIFFSALIYILKFKLNNQIKHVILFSSFASVFTGSYFVGRSHPHNLFIIAPFFILTAFLIMGDLYRKLTNSKIRSVLIVLLFLSFIAYPFYMRRQAVYNIISLKRENYAKGNVFEPQTKKLLQDMYRPDIKMIEQSIRDDEILVLSYDDTFIFYNTEKQNLLNTTVNSIGSSEPNIDSYLKSVYTICPESIVADCALVGSCVSTKAFSVGHLGALPNILRRLEYKCDGKYEIERCEQNLCIASLN